MSRKPHTTISAKPEIPTGIEAWIGANNERTTDGVDNPTNKQVDNPTNKQVDNLTNKQSDDLDEPTAMLSARVPATLIRRLRIRAATEGRPIQEIMTEILRDYLDSE